MIAMDNVSELPAPEEAQRAFADLYDGDYLMSDLMARSPDMRSAVLSLFHDLGLDPPPPHTTTFRGESGAVTHFTRTTMPALGISSIQADQTQVRVRNGRVEGFQPSQT
jgi:hypothetical protein